MKTTRVVRKEMHYSSRLLLIHRLTYYVRTSKKKVTTVRYFHN